MSQSDTCRGCLARAVSAPKNTYPPTPRSFPSGQMRTAFSPPNHDDDFHVTHCRISCGLPTAPKNVSCGNAVEDVTREQFCQTRGENLRVHHTRELAPAITHFLQQFPTIAHPCGFRGGSGTPIGDGILCTVPPPRQFVQARKSRIAEHG